MLFDFREYTLETRNNNNKMCRGWSGDDTQLPPFSYKQGKYGPYSVLRCRWFKETQTLDGRYLRLAQDRQQPNHKKNHA